MSSFTIKPLAWMDSGFEGSLKAGNLGLGYFVECEARQYSCSVSDGRGSLFKVLYRGSKKEAAQAAAQADYATRILSALTTQPDPRDEVIAKLVDALHAIELWDAARGYPISTRHRDTMRAALASAKAVQP